MSQYKLILNVYRSNYAILSRDHNHTLCRFYDSTTVAVGNNELRPNGKIYWDNPTFVKILKTKEYI